MDSVNLTDLRDQIDALMGRVEAGESVEILRDGAIVARITPVGPAASAAPFDFKTLDALAASLPFDPSNAADLVRQMRDDARY